MTKQCSLIPVALTGFVGTGKTTILNQRLKDQASGRAAMIMKKFPDVGLEHNLTQKIAKSDAINGITAHIDFRRNLTLTYIENSNIDERLGLLKGLSGKA